MMLAGHKNLLTIQWCKLAPNLLGPKYLKMQYRTPMSSHMKMLSKV